MKIHSTRKPKNKAESEFYNYTKSKGWDLTKRGWPDFFCWKDDKIICVEVKNHRSRRLKKHQTFIMRELSKRGISCYRWSPDGGFEKIDSETPY